MTVKGMEVASKKSDMARLKMKTFLAVLISFLRRTVDITVRLPRTKINIFLFYKLITIFLDLDFI
jgi:hypothetical protein